MTTPKIAKYPMVDPSTGFVTGNWIRYLQQLPPPVLDANGKNVVYAQGDMLYAVDDKTFTNLGKDTNSTRYLANTGTTNNPKWDTVNVSNGVSGVLGMANGGFGSAIADAAAGRNVLLVTGMLKSYRSFTSSGTWTKPANLDFIIVDVVGAGGGGGGGSYNGSGGASASGSGGGGGYCRKLIQAADLADTVAVTVGAGGVGGWGTDIPGSSGGSSSFGSFCTANGGDGGPVGSNNGTPSSGGCIGSIGANGGSASGGDLNVPGSASGISFAFPAFAQGMAGPGGCCGLFGVGGARPVFGLAAAIPGNNATYYGGGGGGAASGDLSDTALNGGNGYGGIIIVYEYYK